MEKPTRKATVVLLINKDGQVCLARKKQEIHHENGSIGYSLKTYNGYGGKTEWFDFGSIFLTATRELWGEAKVFVFPWQLRKVFRAYFYIKKGDDFEPFMDVSFFFARKWSGDPVESLEMGQPEWFHSGDDTMPYNDMMPADRELFKKAFVGERSVYEVKLFGKGNLPEIKVLEEKL